MGNAAAVAVAAAAAVMVGFARGERWEREVDGDTIDTRMVVEEEEG
jgi:antitoxin component of MazEF toxin-antitoxin module